MEDYKITIETIERYKDMACNCCSDCDYCEAMYERNDKQWCCFDLAIRFIKQVNGEGYEI